MAVKGEEAAHVPSFRGVGYEAVVIVSETSGRERAETLRSTTGLPFGARHQFRNQGHTGWSSKERSAGCGVAIGRRYRVVG
jgi:hypothetical protein